MRIFVTVGSALQPFDRMLRVVDEALSRFPEGTFEGTCQHGTSSVRPRALRPVSSLRRGEFDEQVERADVIVTHAGVGSVKSALDAGHTPIVFARRSALREVVDDHQMHLAREFAGLGDVLVVERDDELAGALESFVRGRRARRTGVQPAAEGIELVRAAVLRGRVHSRRRLLPLALAARLAPALDALAVRGRD